MQAEEEFTAAWADPAHTTIELPPVDVNRVLVERYHTDPPTRMTRTQVWDMEVRKAWDPLTYIPYVVSEARSWGDRGVHHDRASQQKAWLDGTRYGQVLEEVFVDHDRLRVLFLGRARLIGPDGEKLRASDYQPLFHVEHSAGGTEREPTSGWRIVLLTDRPDERFRTAIGATDGMLPGFLEIYLRHNLGVDLTRR